MERTIVDNGKKIRIDWRTEAWYEEGDSGHHIFEVDSSKAGHLGTIYCLAKIEEIAKTIFAVFPERYAGFSEAIFTVY